MTPPIPSSNDIIRLRSGKRQTVGLIVNAVPLNPVATAQISDTSITYPLAELSVADTEDWSEAVAGRLFTIGTGPGLADVTWGVLRRDATSSTLFTDARANGEPGYARNIQQLIQNGQYVTVYDARPAWGWWSSIRNGVFYKFWDNKFSASAANPRPTVRLGEHPRADADPDTGVARITLYADTFHFAGRSTAGHNWSHSAGSLVSSDVDHLTVDFPPGCHEVVYEITDTKARVTRAYRKVFVNGPGFQPFAGTSPGIGRYRLLEAECSQDRVGYTITLTFAGRIEPGDLYPGQMFLLSEVATYADGDTLDNPDAVARSFVGYASELDTRYAVSVSGGRAEVDLRTTVTIHAPMTLAAYVPVAKQTIITRNPPRSWTEVLPVMGNPVGYFHYLTALHAPYLIDGHDFTFDPALLSLRRQTAEFSRSEDLGAHLKQMSTWLDGEGVIASRTDGTTRMLRNPLYMDVTEWADLPTQWTWQPGDIRRELAHTMRYRPEVGQSYVGVFASRGSSETVGYKAVAPHFFPSQAPGQATLDDTSVPFVSTAQVVDRVKQLAGLHHARMNARTHPQPTLADRNLDVAQPCDVDRWHVWQIPSDYDPIGEGFSAERRLCTQTTRRWFAGGKEVTHEWEVQTVGYPGQFIPYNRGGAGIWHAQTVRDTPIYAPVMPDLGLDTPVMFAWNDVQRLARTFNFAQRQTTWRYMAAQIVWAELVDFTSDPLEAVFLAYDPEAMLLALLHMADVTQPFSVTTLKTWPTETLFLGQAQIRIDREEAGYWVVLWRDAHGTHVDRSDDAGSTWGGVEVFGHPDPVNNPEERLIFLAASVLDERLVFTATDGTQDGDGNLVYFVYTASAKGGTISKINNPTDWQVSPSSIALTSTSNAIVGLFKPEPPEPATPLSPVTFQEGGAPPGPGYPHYTITGTGQTSGINDFSNVRRAFSSHDTGGTGGTGTGPGGVAVNVKIDLTAWYTFDSVTFDTAFVHTGAAGRSASLSVTLLDADEVEIASHTETVSDFPADTFTFTAEDLGVTTDRVWYVVVSLELVWESASIETITAFLDNIDITAQVVDFDSDRALYTLNPGSGTYTRRDDNQLLPFHPFGIAAAGLDVTVLARDETGHRTTLLLSGNGGQTWQRRGRMDGFVGAKRAPTQNIGGELVSPTILFGFDKLAVSLDGGVTGFDARGDLAARVEYIGRVDGVAGVW